MTDILIHSPCVYYIVASFAVDVTAVQVSSLSPTLTVSWNAPQDGATVTSYTVHYTSTGSGIQHGGSVHGFQNMSISIPNLIADGRYYNIVVEAHSVHISGFSNPLQFKPCKLTKYLCRICG